MLAQIRPDSNFCLHFQLWSNPVTCSPSQSIAEHVCGLFTQNTNPGCVCKSLSLSGAPPKPPPLPHGWAPRADHAVYTLSLSTTTKAPFQATTPSHRAVQQAVITQLTQHPALTRLWQSPCWHLSPVACRALPEQPGRDGEPVPAGTACPERSPPPTASMPQCQSLDTGPPRHLLRNQVVETGLLQIKDASRGIKVCCSSAYDLEATDQQEEGALFSLGAAAHWVRISRMNLNNPG